MAADVTREVEQAAAELVARFGSHDVAGYFASFSPDASFLFYNHPERLDDRAAYERVWAEWEEQDGFRVLGCRSTRGRIQQLSEEVAIFTHEVDTRVRSCGEEMDSQERETIVFQKVNGRWVAVHEHLSPRT